MSMLPPKSFIKSKLDFQEEKVNMMFLILLLFNRIIQYRIHGLFVVHPHNKEFSLVAWAQKALGSLLLQVLNIHRMLQSSTIALWILAPCSAECQNAMKSRTYIRSTHPKEGVVLPPQVHHQREGLVYTTSPKYTDHQIVFEPQLHKMYVVIVVATAIAVGDHARSQGDVAQELAGQALLLEQCTSAACQRA